MKTAAATIKEFEVMRRIRRGHCLTYKPRVKDEVRFVNKLFDAYSVPPDPNHPADQLCPTELMQQCPLFVPVKLPLSPIPSRRTSDNSFELLAKRAL